MEPHQEGSPQTDVFCCSDCEEQSRFHGISTSGSKSVWSSNSWHFCFHASSFQSNGLFSRGWHSHPLWQVPEEKPVLRVEGPCPACGGHHIPVRVRGVLLLGNGALPSEEKELLLSLPSCLSPYLQPPHDKDRVMKTVPTRQSVQRVTKKEVAPSSPLCHYSQRGGMWFPPPLWVQMHLGQPLQEIWTRVKRRTNGRIGKTEKDRDWGRRISGHLLRPRESHGVLCALACGLSDGRWLNWLSLPGTPKLIRFLQLPSDYLNREKWLQPIIPTSVKFGGG